MNTVGQCQQFFILNCPAWQLLFIFIHQNGKEKYACTNTKKIKIERRIEANNITKRIKTCKSLPIQV